MTISKVMGLLLVLLLFEQKKYFTTTAKQFTVGLKSPFSHKQLLENYVINYIIKSLKLKKDTVEQIFMQIGYRFFDSMFLYLYSGPRPICSSIFTDIYVKCNSKFFGGKSVFTNLLNSTYLKY